MVQRGRRNLIRNSVILSMSALAGCAGYGDTESSAATPPDECSAEPRPQPTPTKEGLQPKAYPTYPEQLSLESAKRFAVAFERAYQHNDFLENKFIEGTDEIDFNIGVPRNEYEEVSNGYIIHVTGELKTSDTKRSHNNSSESPSETAAPSLDEPFNVSFYLTERFALRKSGDATTSTISDVNARFEGATVIVCTNN